MSFHQIRGHGARDAVHTLHALSRNHGNISFLDTLVGSVIPFSTHTPPRVNIEAQQVHIDSKHLFFEATSYSETFFGGIHVSFGGHSLQTSTCFKNILISPVGLEGNLSQGICVLFQGAYTNHSAHGARPGKTSAPPAAP